MRAMAVCGKIADIPHSGTGSRRAGTPRASPPSSGTSRGGGPGLGGGDGEVLGVIGAEGLVSFLDW